MAEPRDVSPASLRAYLLRVAALPLPCPACAQPVSYLEAAQLAPEQLGIRHGERPQLRCIHCGVALEEEVLFTGGRRSGAAVLFGAAMAWRGVGAIH